MKFKFEQLVNVQIVVTKLNKMEQAEYSIFLQYVEVTHAQIFNA